MNTARMTYTKAQGIISRFERSAVKNAIKTNELIVAEKFLKEYKKLNPSKPEPKPQKQYKNLPFFKDENFIVCCPVILEIITIVSQRFGLNITDMYSLSENGKISRKREFVIPRQIVHYIAKNNTSFSLKYIGDNTGGLDHSSVIHSIETVSHYVRAKSTDTLGKAVAKHVEAIEAIFNAEKHTDKLILDNIAQL
jgi:hypothetical protein